MRFCLIFLLFIMALPAKSQDIESRFYSFADVSLPGISVVEESVFYRKHSKISFTEDLRINASNYWKPVDMMAALSKQESYLNRKNTIQKEITSESLGLSSPKPEKEASVQFRVYDPNFFHYQNNRTQNSVYRDMTVPVYYPRFYRSRMFYPYY